MPECRHFTLLMFVAMFWCVCCFILIESPIVHKKRSVHAYSDRHVVGSAIIVGVFNLIIGLISKFS
jgi:uncharacterized membrane protein